MDLSNLTQYEKLWKLLRKHGIQNEYDLKKALKETKPLNIGIMVSKPFESKNTA